MLSGAPDFLFIFWQRFYGNQESHEVKSVVRSIRRRVSCLMSGGREGINTRRKENTPTKKPPPPPLAFNSKGCSRKRGAKPRVGLFATRKATLPRLPPRTTLRSGIRPEAFLSFTAERPKFSPFSNLSGPPQKHP